MFLVRAAFWLTLVILLIPAGDDAGEATSPEVPETSLSPIDAFGAVGDTVADLSAFCQRNPDTCETGSAALRVLAQKAQHGAEMFYEYVSADSPSPEPADVGVQESDPLHARRGTLTETDLAAPWQGPDLQS